MGLVETVQVSGSGNSGTINFYYDATGRKWRKKVYNQTSQQTALTDYNGEIVFETDPAQGKTHALSFIAHEEGRLIPDPQSGQLVYEYHYKDHLGNLRLAFRQPKPTVTHKASMEVVNAYKEDVAFTNVSNTRDNTRGYVSGSSAKVGGTHPIGPWKTLKIKQGDVVNGEVYARYQTNSTGSGINLSLYLTNPSNFRGGSESNRNPTLLNLGLGLSPVPNPANGVPKAQLRYLFYDKDNRFVSSQSVPVTASAANNWSRLALPQFTATQDGYLQVLVVNESNVDVWFDDLSITHTEALIVQENHYDAWGLNLAGIETQGQPDHKFQYNGKEKQSEFGLNWIDYDTRYYDVQLGRWHAVDILAEQSRRWSPYTYVLNNPLTLIDPDGMAARYNWGSGRYEDDGGGEVSWDDVQKEYGIGTHSKSTNVAAYIFDSAAPGHNGAGEQCGGDCGNYYQAIKSFAADKKHFGQWNLIIKRSIAEVGQELEKKYAERSIANMILFTHGSAQVIISNTYYDKGDESRLLTAGNIRGYANLNLSTMGSEKDIESSRALRTIFSLIKYNGNFVLGACNVGNSEDMLKAFAELSRGYGVNLFVNTVYGRISRSDRPGGYLNIGGTLNGEPQHADSYSWIRIANGEIHPGFRIYVNRDTGSPLQIEQAGK